MNSTALLQLALAWDSAKLQLALLEDLEAIR